MHNVWLIARREYLERIRAKSFMVMTLLIPLLMGGILFGAALVNGHSGSMNHVAVVADDPQFAADFGTELSGKDQAKVAVDVYPTSEPGILPTLDAQLKAKDSTLDGYLVVIPSAAAGARAIFQWQPKSKADVIGRARVADAIGATLTREKLTHSGMGAKEVD